MSYSTENEQQPKKMKMTPSSDSADAVANHVGTPADALRYVQCTGCSTQIVGCSCGVWTTSEHEDFHCLTCATKVLAAIKATERASTYGEVTFEEALKLQPNKTLTIDRKHCIHAIGCDDCGAMMTRHGCAIYTNGDGTIDYCGVCGGNKEECQTDEWRLTTVGAKIGAIIEAAGASLF